MQNQMLHGLLKAMQSKLAALDDKAVREIEDLEERAEADEPGDRARAKEMIPHYRGMRSAVKHLRGVFNDIVL